MFNERSKLWTHRYWCFKTFANYSLLRQKILWSKWLGPQLICKPRQALDRLDKASSLKDVRQIDHIQVIWEVQGKECSKASSEVQRLSPSHLNDWNTKSETILMHCIWRMVCYYAQVFTKERRCPNGNL